MLLFLLCHIAVYGQAFSLGLRDSQFAQLGIEYREKWNATVEHSLFNINPGNQKIRLMAGYSQSWQRVRLDITPYVSTLWNRGYWDCGAMLAGKACLNSILSFKAILNPHYDSGIGYATCFTVGTEINVYKAVGLTAQYSTIPDYRLSENRVRVGLFLRQRDLWVQPEISIPVGVESHNPRILCSFGYRFDLK